MVIDTVGCNDGAKGGEDGKFDGTKVSESGESVSSAFKDIIVGDIDRKVVVGSVDGFALDRIDGIRDGNRVVVGFLVGSMRGLDEGILVGLAEGSRVGALAHRIVQTLSLH